MTAERTTGLTLDAGALLALDHPAKAIAMQALLTERPGRHITRGPEAADHQGLIRGVRMKHGSTGRRKPGGGGMLLR